MAVTKRRRTGVREPADSAELARACALLADEKKGEDITILDLRALTYITDFFIIVTVANPRQMRAISNSIDEAMSKQDVRPLGAEGTDAGRWILLDYGDFVVHLFDAEWRRLYDLELLWGDAPRLKWRHLAQC